MKPWGESDAKQRDQVVLRNGDTFGKKATQRFEAALQVSVHAILLAEQIRSFQPKRVCGPTLNLF